MVRTEIDFPNLAGYIINSHLEQFARVALIQELAKYKTSHGTVNVDKLLRILHTKMNKANDVDKPAFASYIAYVEFSAGIAEQRILGTEKVSWFNKLFKRKKIKTNEEV